MKLLVITHEYPPIGGGGSNACYFIAREYAKLGHEVTIVTSSFQQLPLDEIIDNVHIVRVKAMRKKQEKSSFLEMLTFLWSAFWKCNALAKREEFDISQVFFGIPSGPVGWWLKKKYQIPYIIRFGGGDIPGAQKRFGALYQILAPFLRVLWKEADALVANSEGLMLRAQKFESRYAIQIISNGVDVDFFTAVEKSDKEEIQVLFVSRLIEGKGLQYVIPHMGKVNNEVGKKVHLTIVGDGPYRDTLENICIDNHMEQYVSFEGRKNKQELLPYYQGADLFILPSKSEGMPNVVLEAMATGLPILMTPCEGSKELIQGNGVIAPVDHFVDELIRMCKNMDDRITMGRNSAQVTREQFTWYNTAKTYEAILQEIVAEE